MAIFYRCDRPGCKNESQLEMKSIGLAVFNGLSTGTYSTALCPVCWLELQQLYVDLETNFYNKLTKEER